MIDTQARMHKRTRTHARAHVIGSTPHREIHPGIGAYDNTDDLSRGGKQNSSGAIELV